MKRAYLALAFLMAGATAASAQMTKAIGKAQRAADAASAHVAREQNIAPQTKTKAAPPKEQRTKPATGAAQGKSAAGKAVATAKPAAKPDTVPSFVMREVFDYDRTGTRDPFVSLLATSELRPVLTDLHLVGVLYDVTGRRSVAIMRDQSDKLYRATVGQTLGRMRVAQIKPRAVIFTIEEFGFNRQDSLVLADTTKVRTP
ncbi:MAG TPA: hypothetical protein VF737_09885 [Gemmatimonadaceae bacterium]